MQEGDGASSVGSKALDARRVVAEGYDVIAETYRTWTAESQLRWRFLDAFVGLLGEQARDVLDLGCGSGQATEVLAKRGLAVTALDISSRQIELTRQLVPGARCVCADMTAPNLFDADSFDGVVAFYSIFHLPRSEHLGALRQILAWLRRGGVLVATMGSCDCEEWVEQNWLGAAMFWSHYDADRNRALFVEAGFDVVSTEEVTTTEDDAEVTFLWVVARKPK